ncbi:hypothetical protein [Sphingobium sp. WCS2017Hpa-17]|uniref:hypothetical protein n=1 Tax=Sphingobium sp. WCS2017Hpa-17 TaxID=3073638 RepID=UPI00288C53A0|nr:hypothetical protein [Sphingobium sp. WCS2017Hpa-17]
MGANWYRRMRHFNIWVVAIFGIAAIIGVIAIVATLASGFQQRLGPVEGQRPVDENASIAPRFSGAERIAGRPFLAMTVVAKNAADTGGSGYSSKSAIDNRNMLLLNVVDGSSRYILPDNGRRLVQWHVLSLAAGDEALAYVALVGDDAAASYDVLIGSFATGRQAWVARGVTAMDEPMMVDADTMGLILWDGQRPAYHRYGMADLKETLSRPLPLLGEAAQ